MNIENAMWKLRNEATAQQAHVTRETDQIHAVGLQKNGHLRIKLSAVAAGGLDGAAGETKFAGEREAGGLGLIGKNEANLTVQLTAQDVAGNGFEIRSPARQKDTEPWFRRETHK